MDVKNIDYYIPISPVLGAPQVHPQDSFIDILGHMVDDDSSEDTEKENQGIHPGLGYHPSFSVDYLIK